MGFDVDADVDVVLINGDFSSDVGWDVQTWWSIAGGKAILNRATGVENGLRQFGLDLVQGNVYRITFEILVANFINEPAKGITVNMMDQIIGPFNTIGVKTFDIFNISTAKLFSFASNSTDVGDYAEIDWVTIEPLGPYIVDPLGFDWRKPRFANFQTGIFSEYWQMLASQTDKTNCLISYDIP